MAKLSILAGATSQSVNLFVQASNVSTGAGLTGLAYNTSGLIAYYTFAGANTTSTAITLATLSTVTSAYSSGGFIEIDSTHMPGLYRLDLPNAVLAASKGRSVVVMLSGATDMAPVLLEIELTAVDNQSTGFGLVDVSANVVQISGSAVSTSTAQLGVNVVDIAGTASAGTAGYVAPDWGHVNAPTTTVNLSGTTISTSQAVASVSGAVGSVTGAVGSVTGAVGSVTGNVGGNVAGSVASVTGAVGSVTGNVGGNVVGSVASVTGSVASVTGNVGGNVTGSVGSVVAGVNATQINGSSTAAATLAAGMNTVVTGTVGTGSTDTSVVSSALSPSGTALGQFIGGVMIFADNTTTAALQGQKTTISGSTASATPTFTVVALTTAPASGDTFIIV